MASTSQGGIVIEGTHTALRAITRDDLAQLLEWRNHPRLRRYFREVRELNTDNQSAWYESVVLRGSDKARMFAIARRADGALLGACGLTTLDWLRRSGELSLYIGLDDLYCDADYAPDAATSLVKHGFEDLGLHRIWAEVYDFDEPKQRLMNVTGFTQEGRLRDHHWAEGRFWDSLIFGRLEPDRL